MNMTAYRDSNADLDDDLMPSSRPLEDPLQERVLAVATRDGALEPASPELAARQVKWTRIVGYIGDNLAETITLAKLAQHGDTSKSSLKRLFAEAIGVPPYAFVLAMRLKAARQMMRRTDASLSQIALDCGFSSQAHLTTHFRRAYRMSPAIWRKGVRQPLKLHPETRQPEGDQGSSGPR